MSRKLITVSAAILLDPMGRVLLAQRPEGKAMAGLWEFPGGKIEVGESPEEALIRELKEELDIEVSRETLRPALFVSYGYENFHLLMPVFLCNEWKNNVFSREGQALSWVKEDIGDYEMPPADAPIVGYLKKEVWKNV